MIFGRKIFWLITLGPRRR